MPWPSWRSRWLGRAPAAYDPGQPLVSIHVPKSGGSTVRAHLQAWFGDQLRYHYAEEARGQLPAKWPLGPGMCVHGHFNSRRGFGVSDYYPEARQFITFLRDPLESHISLYFYLKQHQDSYHYQGRPYRILDEFPDLPAFIEGICKDREHRFALSFLRYLPASLLARAKPDALLRKFLHVGITADLDTSVAILARKMGRPVLERQHLNAAPRDEAIAYQQLLAGHERHYGLEHEIYRQANELHRREAAELGLNETAAPAVTGVRP